MANSIEVNGKTIELDEENYMVDLSEWNEDIAKVLAKQDEMELTDNHWEVIKFLREYYQEFQIAPAVRVLTKEIGKNLRSCETSLPLCWFTETHRLYLVFN